MEIKITLDSPAIQEKFDRGGAAEVVFLINHSLIWLAYERLLDKDGPVFDENSNIAGRWEIRA